MHRDAPSLGHCKRDALHVGDRLGLMARWAGAAFQRLVGSRPRLFRGCWRRSAERAQYVRGNTREHRAVERADELLYVQCDRGSTCLSIVFVPHGTACITTVKRDVTEALKRFVNQELALIACDSAEQACVTTDIQ